ncbi:MAG: beta-galactosidase [Polyangiaceae bacterium]
MAFPAVCSAVALGVCVHLPPPDTLALTQELGTEWIRIDFNWDLVEPQQGQVDYSAIDAVLDEAKAKGLKVFATVGYGAAWASISGDKQQDGPSNDVPNPTELRRFVMDSVKRYADGRVQAWGTWNEPNLGDFFEGTQQQWIDGVFTVTVDAIKDACPTCTVVGPELASIGNSYDEYLDAALKSRGNKLDAVSFHIYASFPEDDSAAGLTKDSFYNKLEQHRVIDIGGNILYEGPLSAREVLVKNGLSSMPLWITETGQQAAPGDAAALEKQRKYLERVVVAQATRPWWQKTFFYEISEEHPGGLWPDIHWGLALRVADPDTTYADNFQKKPAFDDLKQCIADGGAGPIPGSGGGSGSGGAGSGGTAGGAAGNAGVAGSGGAGGGPTATPATAEDDGCGCRAPRTNSPHASLLASALALLVFRTRRKRARPSR